MLQFRRGAVIATIGALVMSVSGAAVGVGSAAAVAHPAKTKKHTHKHGRRGPRGPRGPQGPVGATGPAGAGGTTYVVVTAPAAATSGATVTNVYQGDGLRLDYACASNGATCDLFAAGPAGGAAAITWEASNASTVAEGSAPTLAPYTALTPTAITASAPNGVRLAEVQVGTTWQVTFSYAMVGGKVVTGTLGLTLGPAFGATPPAATGSVWGSITAN
jgi:hypothetical protein